MPHDDFSISGQDDPNIRKLRLQAGMAKKNSTKPAAAKRNGSSPVKKVSSCVWLVLMMIICFHINDVISKELPKGCHLLQSLQSGIKQRRSAINLNFRWPIHQSSYFCTEILDNGKGCAANSKYRFCRNISCGEELDVFFERQ